MTGTIVLTHIVEAIMTTQGAKAHIATCLSHAVSRRGVLFPAVSPEPPTPA